MARRGRHPVTTPQQEPLVEPEIVPGTSRPIPVDPEPATHPNLDPQTGPQARSVA